MLQIFTAVIEDGHTLDLMFETGARAFEYGITIATSFK